MLDFRKQKLLVIAPHPDDEVVGCGGLIKRIKDEGGKVYVLFLTVGDTKDFSKKGISFGKEREKEIESVARFLKFNDYRIAFKGNNYHLKLDILGQKALMDVIERDCPVAIEIVKPTIVAFPSPFSYNQDHRIAAAAAHASLRSAPKDDKHFVPLVLSYEEPSDGWTFHSQPELNFFVELDEKDIIVKQKAMQLYASQDRINNNPRSIEILKNLSELRGSQIGAKQAEAFFAHRIIA